MFSNQSAESSNTKEDALRNRGMFFLSLAVAAIGFALFVQLALEAVQAPIPVESEL